MTLMWLKIYSLLSAGRAPINPHRVSSLAPLLGVYCIYHVVHTPIIPPLLCLPPVDSNQFLKRLSALSGSFKYLCFPRFFLTSDIIRMQGKDGQGELWFWAVDGARLQWFYPLLMAYSEPIIRTKMNRQGVGLGTWDVGGDTMAHRTGRRKAVKAGRF